jgi:hypothetical protein
MLRLILIGDEYFDEVVNEFTTVGDVTLDLEHSLVSLSKWESIYQKPFLAPGDKTSEETIGYIRAMIITPDVPDEVFNRLSQKELDRIRDYIESKESATSFGMMPQSTGRGEVITSELIYYWMVAFNIPFECETWHLNRLFALIRICNVKNSKPRKMSKHEVATRNRELNARRRSELGTAG